MAYVMSDEMRARIEADAKKMKSEKPFPQRARETKYAGTVKQTETQQEEKPAALIKTTSQDGSYKMSSGMAKRIREDAGRYKSTGSFAAVQEDTTPTPRVYRSEEDELAPYKTYYQPTDGGEAGKGIQMTKEFSEKRLRDEAYSLYKDYGGKSYNDIQAAADSETGTDFMSRYRKDVLTQIALDAEDAPAPVVRTREDIVNDIAATDAELEILYGEADTSRGDPWKMTDIKNRASALEGQKEQYEQELYMYDQGQIYSAIPGYSDYAKNSGFTGEGKGTTYNFINNVNGIRGTMATQGMLHGGYGKYAPYEQMTQEEINTYNYLYNVSGKDAAEKYLEYLEYDLNRRQQEENYNVMYDYASGNFGKAAGASIASILTNLGSGIGYLDVVGQKIAKNATGSEKPIDYNRRAQTGYYITQGAREGAMSDMSETGKFIYSTAMSMGDSLAVLGISALTGGTGATMLLGGSAATSTMHEAKEFGASDKQALALGFVAGAAETVMEKLPLESVLNIGAGEGFKATVKNILKQGVTEATEEVLTTLANTVADVIIMGDKDILARSYEKYIAQGFTPEEAKSKAEEEWIMGLVSDALGGFISGAAFGLGGTVIKKTRQNNKRRKKGKAISTSEYTLPLLVEHVENGYTDEATGDTMEYSDETKKTAAEIKKTLEDGKAVSNAKKGKLAEQVLRDNAAFERTELPKILQQAQEKEDAAEAERTATEKEETQPEEKAGVVDKIKSRLNSRKKAADSGKAIEPAAAKVLAEEVLASESTYSKKTKAAAQTVINSDTVSDADAAALVKGIQKDVPEFSGYEVQEILAEASIAAQERTENKQGREMSEKTKTAEPQTAAQQTAKEGVNANEQTGRTERNDEGDAAGDTAGDTARSDRGRRRFSDAYSDNGAPAQSRNRRDVRSEAHRTQTARERQYNVAALRVEATSAADIGVKNGSSEKTMYVMPEEAYDEELRSLQVDAKENGIELHFFTGVMEANGRLAEAVITGNVMYVKADGHSRTASELYDHEKFHKTFRGKAKMVAALANWIKENYTRETFDSIVETYYDKYNAVYGLDNMSEEDATRLVMEEILADAFAGLNKFGVQTSEYTDIARAAAEETGGAKPSEYNENRGRGPPKGMTYDDVKNAVREVLSEVMGTEGNKNTADDGGARFAIAEREYNQAEVDERIMRLVNDVKNGQFKQNDKVVLGVVNTTAAARIKEITGIDVADFKIAVEARQIDHILKDHGENGSADRSMSNDADIAKLGYVLSNADSILPAGKTRAYTYMKNGRNRTADTVIYEKLIGEKSYYVVQAVADTKAKTLYIVTAFQNKPGYKNEVPQLTNVTNLGATSENGSAATSNISMHGTADDVKEKFAISDDYDYDIAPEDRSWEDASNRKIESYAYAHPELREFYKKAARDMWADLDNSVKGERWGVKDKDGYYIGGAGTTRSTTENIARLLDNGHMTYKRIREALLTILYKTDDAKLMNKADVKKVELELDNMLQEGYTDPTGLEIEPNREYRLLLDAVKEGYDNIEDAEAAWSAEARDSEYDEAEAAAANARADAMYDKAYQNPDIDLYEDFMQEERDALGEIVDSADEMRLQRMAAEREAAAAELNEADERVRMAEIERRENVDAYFDAFNQEELDEERRRMDAAMQKALQNPDIENAPDTAAEHWESITAQVVEEKRRELQQEAIAKINELDAYMPDDVSAEEILAAQEMYKQLQAERKALEDAKYEGLTAEEAEAAREADAKAAKAEYLEGAAKKNFVGSEGLNKLGIKIANSIANYKSSRGLWDRAKANAALVRSVEQEIRKMHPSTEEEYFANGIINNNISETSIPRHIDVERVLDLVDLKVARNAGRTDLLAAQKADINNRNRELASEKFKNAERAKPVKLLHLNYMTPRRAMIEMFGAEQGEEIYRTFFAPVRTNDAERIRFAERMRQGALEIVGADGKKGKLTKEERAVTQMLMEGKAAQEMLVQIEGGSRERIEEAVKKILKGEKIHDEKTVYVVGEEDGTELSGREMDVAMRTAAQQKAQEAIDSGIFDKKKIDAVRVTNAAKYFEEQYNLMYDAINEFLVAHGEEPIGFIKGYAPHTQPESAMDPIERLLAFMNAPTDITDLRAEIAGETHLRKPNRKWNPHFLSRGFNAETEYDAYKGFEEYVDYISEVFYHMDDIMRLRAASRYLRTQYTTEDSKQLLKQIEDIRNGSYFEKMNFLAANNRIGYGEKLIGAEIDAKLDEYVDKILNEEENKTAVSSSLVMWLDNYTNLLAGKQNAMDRGLEQTAGRKGIRALNKAVNRLISAQVVGNISSALNQTAQLPFTITELGADNVAKALWDLTKNYKEMRRWSLDNDFLRARKGTTVLNYDIAGKLTQGLAKPLEMSDWLMSQLTARAAYNQALKQGMDAESAMEYSVQKAEDIMGSRNKASKPVAFSTKRPMMRLVNAYQIEVLNQWEHIVKDLPREYKAIAKSRGKWAAAGRIAKDLVVYLILAALINRVAEETYGGTPAPLDLFGIIGNFVAAGHGLTLNEGIVRVFNNMVGRELLPEDHTFDSQMPDEFDWGAAWEDTGYTLSSEVPFLNNVLAVAGLTDDKTVFAAGFADARKSFGKAIDHFFVTDEERKDGEQESAEVLDGLYDVIMGVSEFVMGGRQIQKTLQGITTVAGHGEKDNKGKLMYPVENTVGNWLKGTLFGKNALENSRAYYASGASPLTSTRNEQYFGMVERGVDEEEAYVIAQEIYYIEADRDENGNTVSNSQLYNRLEYIDGLDISEDAKQYLISALYNDLGDDSKSKESFNALTELGVSENDASKITTELYSMTADVDENGEKVSGSKFMNQMEYVMNLKAPDDVKDYLALSIASDAAYKRYEERGLEKAGVEPAEFMLGWAFYQSATGKDKLGQTEKFLKQQGVSSNDVSKIIAALKKQ